jgi:hypothetical protein
MTDTKDTANPRVVNGYAIRARADLLDADLRYADLRGADLTFADLRGANLTGADLTDADIRNANLRGANLSNATMPAIAHVPATGAFTAWKATRCATIELRIPADAQRTGSYVGRKCRASHAVVVAYYDYAGRILAPTHLGIVERRSIYDRNFLYPLPGETVRPSSYNDDPRVESAPGIHFFMTRAEAIDYPK